MSGLLSRAPSNQFYPSLSHQRCSQNSHLGALKICFINFKKLKIMLPASSVLPGLTTYLRSFVLYIGLLSNPAFSTKFFFLPLNQWTTKPFPVSLVSSSCMFRLANSVRLPTLDSFVFHHAHLKSSGSTRLLLSSTITLEQSFLLSPKNNGRRVPSIESFTSSLVTHFFSSGLWMLCLCACSCLPLVSSVCVRVGGGGWAGEWWEICWIKCRSVFLQLIGFSVV